MSQRFEEVGTFFEVGGGVTGHGGESLRRQLTPSHPEVTKSKDAGTVFNRAFLDLFFDHFFLVAQSSLQFDFSVGDGDLIFENEPVSLGQLFEVGEVRGEDGFKFGLHEEFPFCSEAFSLIV